MKPLVSVVMPAYNAGWSIACSIDSVLEQSYENFELIIVDDCSRDDTVSIAMEYAQRDSRVRVIVCEKNGGVAFARNTGIAQAKGKYIALLDSDDVWLPDKISRQVELLERTGAQIAYCSYDFIDKQDMPILRPFIVPETTNLQKMKFSNVIGCSTILAVAELLQTHPFRGEWYHEDYVLWMELLAIPVKAVGDKTVLTHYRKTEGSRSDNKKNAAKHRWNTYRKALGMGVLSSVVAFCGYAVNGVLKHYIQK